MATLKEDILPAEIYNTLPNIRAVFDVPEANASDVADLKDLLAKHELSDRVRIKLIHIHFRLKDGEVFTARDLEVPKHGSISIMQPLVVAEHPNLYGYHFFVDNEGNLTAYEYMEAPGPDLSDKKDFIEEFCQMIVERGLQHKLGLSLRHAEDNVSIHELEYGAKRTCIDVPYEIPLPYNEHSFNTTTEFVREWPKNPEGFQIVGETGELRQLTKSHKHHSHCRHTDPRHADPAEYNEGLSDGATDTDDELSVSGGWDGLYFTNELPREIELAGSKLDPTSGLFEIVSYVHDVV